MAFRDGLPPVLPLGLISAVRQDGPGVSGFSCRNRNICAWRPISPARPSALTL